MIRAYNSELISALAKKVLMQIIDNMEEIAIPATRH